MFSIPAEKLKWGVGIVGLLLLGLSFIFLKNEDTKENTEENQPQMLSWRQEQEINNKNGGISSCPFPEGYCPPPVSDVSDVSDVSEKNEPSDSKPMSGGSLSKQPINVTENITTNVTTNVTEVSFVARYPGDVGGIENVPAPATSGAQVNTIIVTGPIQGIADFDPNVPN